MEPDAIATTLVAFDDGVKMTLSVQPRARRNALVGVHAGALKVSLTAPPVDGKANKALVAFMADRLGVSKHSVTLLSGHQSRLKRLQIVGLSLEQAVERLRAAV